MTSHQTGSLQIGVVGTGYVGLVVGTCLAEMGHQVRCADQDKDKIQMLRKGRSPIYESELEPKIQENLQAGRLSFVLGAHRAARKADIVFIAVGTPPDSEGEADLSNVWAVADEIGPVLKDGAVVATKSTVPVGTTRQLEKRLQQSAPGEFSVCSNPEFLKEGSAVEDFLYPDRVVCGVEDQRSRAVLQQVYEPLVRTGNPILFMNPESSELTKYAANGMLATRISFINELSHLCEQVGADVEQVRRGISEDPRIGPHFLFAGMGYGGSCFPKDVQALVQTGRREGVELSILRETHRANQRHLRWIAQKIKDHFPGSLQKARIAIWGLAFKPGTDNMRNAPSRFLINTLLEEGADLTVHDPQAIPRAHSIWGERIQYADDPYQALEGNQALVLITEWLPYRQPDWEKIRTRMEDPVLFDGRNLFEPEAVEDRGIAYHGIGRRGT